MKDRLSLSRNSMQWIWKKTKDPSRIIGQTVHKRWAGTGHQTTKLSFLSIANDKELSLSNLKILEIIYYCKWGLLIKDVDGKPVLFYLCWWRLSRWTLDGSPCVRRAWLAIALTLAVCVDMTTTSVRAHEHGVSWVSQTVRSCGSLIRCLLIIHLILWCLQTCWTQSNRAHRQIERVAIPNEIES